jgi:superfamily II DNA or RNA helicase
MELRNYQKDVINKVLSHLQKNKRCCVSLATGGGKTVIFSQIVNHIESKILICVHREELVYQTSATLKKEHDVLLPKTKSKNINKNVCVAMVQTLHNRIKKNEINEIDKNTVLSKLKILTFRMKLNCNQFYMLSGDKIKTNEYKEYYRILLKNLYKLLLN